MIDRELFSGPVSMQGPVSTSALTVIIYIFSMSIVNDVRNIANYGTISSGVLGALKLFILIPLFIKGRIVKYWPWYLLVLGLINILYNLMYEVIFFKFASCFNLPSNAIVVARSSMVILLMVIMLWVAGFAIIHFLLRGQSGTLLALLLLLPSIVMIILNLILIARLSPQLNYFIQPSSLRMGFFNPLEMSQIQNGSYRKTSTFEQQIIGNLNDVVYSSNKVLYDKRCGAYTHNHDCTNYYMRTYSYQITCTNQSAAFYKDCANASSLQYTLHM
jgi:hypothetical protein